MKIHNPQNLWLITRSSILALVLYISVTEIQGYTNYYIWNHSLTWDIEFFFVSCLVFLAWPIIDLLLTRRHTSLSKLWKIFTGYAGFWISIGLLSSAVFYTAFYEERTFEFLWRLERAKSNHHAIYIREAASFPWEKICFLGPYGRTESIQKMLGEQYILEHIDTSNDGLSYLIFALPDKHTLVIGIPRNYFEAGDEPGCLPYQETKKLLLEGKRI